MCCFGFVCFASVGGGIRDSKRWDLLRDLDDFKFFLHKIIQSGPFALILEEEGSGKGKAAKGSTGRFLDSALRQRA